MLSRKLWRALNDPPTFHPLFWRTIYGTGATQFASRNYHEDELAEKIGLSYLLALVVLWVVTNLSAGTWQLALLNLLFVVLSVPLFVLVGWILRYTLLNGVINGLLWALRISTLVATERENGRFELVWLAPPGALGAAMAVCTGCLYRKATLHQFRFQSRILLVAAGFLGLLAIAVSRPANATPSVSWRLLNAIYAIALVAALYLDSRHSPIMGSLVGMLTPTYTTTRADARLWTVGIYLLIQLITLLSALLAANLIVPGAYHSLNLSGWIADISPPLIGLAVFYGVREAMITLLWYGLARQLNANPQEMCFWP